MNVSSNGGINYLLV